MIIHISLYTSLCLIVSSFQISCIKRIIQILFTHATLLEHRSRTFKILQIIFDIYFYLSHINNETSTVEISEYKRTDSHLDFLSGVVSCEQVKKKKKKKEKEREKKEKEIGWSHGDVAGPKITNRRIWRGREADEGSEYFLHAVPMGYTHTCTRLRGQRRVGHHRTATRQRTTC